jgi:aldehyde:ferredoxin oxidoreductase
MEDPLKAGDGDRYLTDWFGSRLTRDDIEKMIDSYYEEKGWDPRRGLPTESRLRDLGLEEYAGLVKEA